MKRRTIRDQWTTIDRLEARLADVEPYEDIARAIHDRTVVEGCETGNLELAYRAAVAEVEIAHRARMLLAAFDQLSPATRYEILGELFDDDEIRDLLASRRGAVAGQRARARSLAALDLRTLDEGQVVDVGLFQRHRVESARRLGRRSDFCSRALTARVFGPDGRVRIVSDRLLLRGAYDGPTEYPRAEWEGECLTDHSVVRVGVAVTDGARESFDPVIYAGSRLDVARDGQIVRTRLSVGYVEVDGEDVFTTTE